MRVQAADSVSSPILLSKCTDVITQPENLPKEQPRALVTERGDIPQQQQSFLEAGWGPEFPPAPFPDRENYGLSGGTTHSPSYCSDQDAAY